ncbi:unnamed protein product [Tetraodon nigroviridis]|uniref:Chromosome undetermined SCAF15074, whole genome shotgun sequence n=1 Tax=Tetraodon nigroviridis TaxID=99883 RepID=Q4RH13_TETNG|nr:unnamed protein product [Tetraodon nigroviridis]
MFNGSDNLEILTMSSNFLRVVPRYLPSNLYRLHLKSNKLEKIPEGAFSKLPNLRELYLQNNLLSNEGMENETFSYLSSLECLDLSNNNLSTVPTGLPRSLVLLHLEKNVIHSIPGDALTSVRNLEYLLLHNNKLRSRSIHPTAFQGLKKLHTLHMYNNLLERVPRGLPRRAKTLMLLHNSITEIGRNDLSLLYTLEELNLSYNKLTSPKLHREAFRKLRVLKTLDLSGNSLRSLPLGLPRSLQTLEIKNNQLSSIPDGALTGMKKLQKLILSDNQLKLNSVYQGAWMELSALTVGINQKMCDGAAGARQLRGTQTPEHHRLLFTLCSFQMSGPNHSTCQPTSFPTSRQTCLRRWSTFTYKVTASPVFPPQHLKALLISRASFFGLTNWLWAPRMREPLHICPIYKSLTSVQETLNWPPAETR